MIVQKLGRETVPFWKNPAQARLLFHRSLVVLELDVLLVQQADEKVELEIPVRGLHETKRRVPAPQIPLQPQNVLTELLGSEVVLRVPGNRPAGSGGEGNAEADGPIGIQVDRARELTGKGRRKHWLNGKGRRKRGRPDAGIVIRDGRRELPASPGWTRRR